MKLSRTTWCSVVLAALMVAAFVLYSMGAIPYKVYIVHTGSMSPTIPTESAVIVREGQWHVGQVATFTVHGTTVTHRIKSINAEGFITTKGDANRSVDPWHITKSDIVGGVVAAPRKLGWLLVFLGHVPGALTVILFIASIWQCFGLAKAFDTQEKPAVAAKGRHRSR
jgi:signal peptidase I